MIHELADPRIHYIPNPTSIGAAGNLDQAFNSTSLLEGDFAFVLEDDNALLPSFISSNIQMMDFHYTSLLMRNQLVYEQFDDTWQATSDTTKSRLYEDGRVYRPIEIHATVLLFDCIANGGLFWRPQCIKSNFQVGPTVLDAGIQEFCRTTQINDDLLFAACPLAIWTRIEHSCSARSRLSNRAFGRCIQTLRRKLLAKYGNAIVEVARELAKSRGCSGQLRAALVDSLYVPEIYRSLCNGQHSGLLLKAAVKRATVSDVIKDYVLQ